MAYKPLKGTLVPTVVPPEEKDEPVYQRSSFNHNQSNVLHLPIPHSPSPGPVEKDKQPHFNTLTSKFDSDPAIDKPLELGDKVARRVRPNDLGVVVTIVYEDGQDKAATSVWVEFAGKPALPYQLVDLLKIRMH